MGSLRYQLITRITFLGEYEICIYEKSFLWKYENSIQEIHQTADDWRDNQTVLNF